MKRVVQVIASALIFGLVAGASMVGVNVAAQKASVSRMSATAETMEALAGGGADGGKNVLSRATESSAPAVALPLDQKEAGTIPEGYMSVRDVAKQCTPAVVAITNTIRYQQYGYSIFGPYSAGEQEVPASGSGVIIGKTDDELLIVTNNHVVADSSALSVSFFDDAAVDAKIKGTDASADLAVVAVQLSNIPTETMNAIRIITIGSSDEIEVGDQVVAIGNALGYGQSVTTGIISAKNRDVETTDGTEMGLLQTDAAINPGNSGGALLNMKGELIGINVAKYSSTEVEGMGYSIPSSKAQNIIDNLSALQTRDAVPEEERGYLGVQVKNIDKSTSQSFDMPQGVFIYKFTEGSTAQNSGLQEKDIITKLDGQGVTNFNDLQSLLQKYRAGEEVTVTVQRQDGSGKYVEQEVKVTLGNNPQPENSTNSGSGNKNQGGSQDPFANPDDRGNEGNNGNNGDSEEDGNYAYPSMEDIWQEFERFFSQYQR